MDDKFDKAETAFIGPRTGEYALITGAGGGLGREYAKILAGKGYNLILVDINEKSLYDTMEAVKNSLSPARDGGRCAADIVPVVQDLAEDHAPERIRDLADAAGMVVTVIVNNAGVFFFDDFCEVAPERIELMLKLHVRTPVALCRLFLPQMKSGGKGYVLNVSSLAAWMPWPYLGMYGCTKRFVRDFSSMMRLECHGTGISVTSACFGAVDTPLYRLSPPLRRLAHRIGVMISPEQAAGKSLKAMFGKKKTVMPGLVNRIARPLLQAMPDCIVRMLFGLVRKYNVKL